MVQTKTHCFSYCKGSHTGLEFTVNHLRFFFFCEMQHKDSDICKFYVPRCSQNHSHETLKHAYSSFLLFRGCHQNLFLQCYFHPTTLDHRFASYYIFFFFIFTDKQCSMTRQPQKHSYQHTGTILL